MDRSFLDSLYETSVTKQAASANGASFHTPKAPSWNPFEADDCVHDPNIFYSGYNYSQNMLYYPSLALQPAGFIQQHNGYGQAIVPQQQQVLAEQSYQQRYLQIAGNGIHQQQPIAMAGHNYLQRQVPVRQQGFVNPCMEQGSRNRSSSFSLL